MLQPSRLALLEFGFAMVGFLWSLQLATPAHTPNVLYEIPRRDPWLMPGNPHKSGQTLSQKS